MNKQCVRCGKQGHSSHQCKMPIVPPSPVPPPVPVPPVDEQTDDYNWGICWWKTLSLNQQWFIRQHAINQGADITMDEKEIIAMAHKNKHVWHDMPKWPELR